MGKALTKEDLLYILNGVLKISKNSNNALTMQSDGFYTEDYHNDLLTHTNNNDIHIDANLKTILTKFSLDINNNLLWDSVQINNTLSKEPNNAITLKSDGLYVEDIAQNTKNHISDNDIHVTLQDKNKWNGIKDEIITFVSEELQTFEFIGFHFVTLLPPDNQAQSNILYILTSDSNLPFGGDSSLWAWDGLKWHTTTLSNSTLNLYALKTDLHEHSNLDNILNKFTLDSNDDLLFNNKPIKAYKISSEPYNAIKSTEKGLYVPDYSNLVNSLKTGAALSKTLLWYGDITNSGKYILSDNIENYSCLLIEYYYRPRNPDVIELNEESQHAHGCAKTAIVDTDTLIELRQQGIDYMLELGYGTNIANVKLYCKDDYLWINYYNQLCIYKITGLGSPGENSGDIPDIPSDDETVDVNQMINDTLNILNSI